MNVDELTALAVDALDDLKAVDVRMLDVRGKTSVTDMLVVATGTSGRHVKSLAEYVVTQAKERKEAPLGVEGLDAGEWALIDLGDVVVHVMQAEVREFYQLEKLWETEPPTARPAELPGK
ncbi:MAG: ribosome silencing factor [Gammaproteobacteria bacterium]|nr:ribosome silencing factor [Gammaproteobacteria bacterium]